MLGALFLFPNFPSRKSAPVRAAVAQRFVALVGPVASFVAIRAEVFDGFAVAPFGVMNALIAILSSGGGSAGEEQKTAESQCRDGLAEKRRKRQSRKFHNSLQERARAGFGIDVLGNQTLVWREGCNRVGDEGAWIKKRVRQW